MPGEGGGGICTGPQMIPEPQMIPKLYRKWYQDRKWSPNCTANDPGTQMIPVLDRKWSRKKSEEWHGGMVWIEN